MYLRMIRGKRIEIGKDKTEWNDAVHSPMKT